MSRLNYFAGASGCVAGFSTRNKFLKRGLLNRVVGVVGFAEPFLNFIDDTVVWCLGSRLGLGGL